MCPTMPKLLSILYCSLDRITCKTFKNWNNLWFFICILWPVELCRWQDDRTGIIELGYINTRYDAHACILWHKSLSARVNPLQWWWWQLRKGRQLGHRRHQLVRQCNDSRNNWRRVWSVWAEWRQRNNRRWWRLDERYIAGLLDTIGNWTWGWATGLAAAWVKHINTTHTGFLFTGQGFIYMYTP